jgi:hypothetical protein
VVELLSRKEGGFLQIFVTKPARDVAGSIATLRARYEKHAENLLLPRD